jgi:hypothetical protein
MEFATFRAAMIELLCQIVRSGRRLIYRLLSWTPWQGAFLRLAERLQRLAVLRGGSNEVGAWMPRSVWAFECGEGVGHGE